MSNLKIVFEPVGDETPLTLDAYHQQAAVLAGAEALWKVDPTCFGAPAPKTSAEWADETTGYTEDSRAVLTAATPHLRAAWEQELREAVTDETPLTLDTYQQQAAKTAIYPLDKAREYLVAGLAGEVGELASLFAKVWRGDGDLNHDHAKAELGDILWFVAMLAEQLDTDLSEVAQRNLDKLADRQQRGKLKGNGDNR